MILSHFAGPPMLRTIGAVPILPVGRMSGSFHCYRHPMGAEKATLHPRVMKSGGK